MHELCLKRTSPNVFMCIHLTLIWSLLWNPATLYRLVWGSILVLKMRVVNSLIPLGWEIVSTGEIFSPVAKNALPKLNSRAVWMLAGNKSIMKTRLTRLQHISMLNLVEIVSVCSWLSVMKIVLSGRLNKEFDMIHTFTFDHIFKTKYFYTYSDVTGWLSPFTWVFIDVSLLRKYDNLVLFPNTAQQDC